MTIESGHMKNKPTILIVEDEPMTAKLLAYYLKQHGAVTITANPREAVASYMVNPTDIVFIDVNYTYEDKDGFDILQSLLFADDDAFAVMFSSDNNKALISKAEELGAQGFITKPISAADFAYYIDKFNQKILPA